MDTIKKTVLNEKDLVKRMTWLKENFEKEAYSFWKMDYDKLKDECEIDYITRN